MERLRMPGLEELFLFEQIGRASRSEDLRTIAGQLNIGTDTFAFIDDNPRALSRP